jgi:hypothetical protein
LHSEVNLQPVLEPLRQDAVPVEPSEADYAEFCATVMASARGRWFLAEYACRHRKADTDAMLTALHRIEDMVRAAPSEPPLASLRDELRALVAMVRETRSDLGRAGGAESGTVSAASKAMALLDLLEQRIEYSLTPGDDRAPLPAPAIKQQVEPEIVPAPIAELRPDATRARLSIVAVSELMPPRLDPAAFPSAALLPPLDPADAGPNIVLMSRPPQIRPAIEPPPALSTSPHQLFAVSERAAAAPVPAAAK